MANEQFKNCTTSITGRYFFTTNYDSVKQQLAAWLPKVDAERHPTSNTQRKWADKKKRKRNYRFDESLNLK